MPDDPTPAPGEFEILCLRRLAPEDAAFREARAWVETMTPERDREDGPDFWRWIERHRVEDAHDALLGTRLLRETATGRIVATASLVSDDRDVGRLLGIDGIWLGGVNVHHECRGRNLVDVILGALTADVRRAADERGEAITVNLVTAPRLSGLYERHGFARMGLQGGPSAGEALWCRRVFRPGEWTESPREACPR